MTIPPRTPAQRQEALEARDRRRKVLEAAWAEVGPELEERFAGEFTVRRRDRGIVLVWAGTVPVRVRPILERRGLSELFTLESDDDLPDEITDLGILLRDELELAGWATHGFTTTEDHTGPLVFVTAEPTAAQGEEIDRLCRDFARRHDVEAGWEHDGRGPIIACTP